MLSSDLALEAMYATGHWLLEENRAPHALEIFRLMTATAPTDERAWLGLGAAHEQLGQRDIAAELYALALEVGPSARCALARARVLATHGDAAAVDDAFEVALEAARASGDVEMELIVLRERGAS